MEQRGFALYEKFRKNIQTQLNQYDIKEKEVSNKYRALSQLFKTVTDKLCIEEFSSLYKEIVDETSELYKERFQLLEKCYDKYDYGLTSYMEKVSEQIKVIEDDLYSCNRRCIFNNSNESDKDIIECYRKCYEVSFKETGEIQEILLYKIEENTTKLKKFL